MENLKDFIELNERMSDFDIQYRRLIKKIWKVVHPDKNREFDKFKKEREELDKAIQKVDKKKIKELFAKLLPNDRIEKMSNKMEIKPKGDYSSNGGGETKKQRSVRMQREQAYRAMENESVEEDSSLSLNEMLLNESAMRDVMRLHWALEELRFPADAVHVAKVVSKSIKKRLDPELMVGLVTAESSWRHNVQNHNRGSNDFGLFQLNNLWHNQHRSNIDAHIDAGIDHFKWCMKTERNNIRRALSRYNTGGGDSAAGRSYASYVLRVKDQVVNKSRNYIEPEESDNVRAIKQREKIKNLLR